MTAEIAIEGVARVVAGGEHQRFSGRRAAFCGEFVEAQPATLPLMTGDVADFAVAFVVMENDGGGRHFKRQCLFQTPLAQRRLRAEGKILRVGR